MRARLKVNGQEIIIPNIKKASNLEKFFGLMFKSKNTNALLFEFNKGKRQIHSLFCPLFLAVWLNESRIVDSKLIKPCRFSVNCEQEFDKLIEIPFNEKYSKVINFFLSLERKI